MSGSPSNFHKSVDDALEKVRKDGNILPKKKYPEEEYADLIGGLLGIGGALGLILGIQAIFGL